VKQPLAPDVKEALWIKYNRLVGISRVRDMLRGNPLTLGKTPEQAARIIRRQLDDQRVKDYSEKQYEIQLRYGDEWRTVERPSGSFIKRYKSYSVRMTCDGKVIRKRL
jgi:hypothetical protein